MLKLPIRTWILNDAAALSGQHGAVTRQVELSSGLLCSPSPNGARGSSESCWVILRVSSIGGRRL
jgi:hypothetical protein